jgi:ankyrin repeat protein
MGIPAIAHACLSGKYDMLVLLLKYNADPNPMVGDEPLLHLVSRTGECRMLEKLLKAGANPDCVDRERRTAIMNMAGDEISDIEERIDLFVEYGADVDIVDIEGKTALHHSVDYNNVEMAQVLLANYCDPDIQDRYGNTPLHYLQEDNPILIQNFTDSFVDFSIQNKDGESLEKYLKIKNL